MKWFPTKRLPRLADEIHQHLCDEGSIDEVAKTLALAFGHACHPSDSYGDKDQMDRMLERIRSCPFTACDSGTAQDIVSEWRKDRLTAREAFERIWGMDFEEFVERLVKHLGVT